MNGTQLCGLMKGMAPITMATIANIFMPTTMSFTRADRDVPRMMSQAVNSVISTAGMSMTASAGKDVPVGGDRKRRAGNGVRQMQAETLQRGTEIAAPADRDQRAAHEIFEQQAPADHPGDALAHGGVGVGIGAAGNRHEASEFGVAQRGEQARQARQHEGQRHRGAGMDGRFGARLHEERNADRGADAEGDQVTQAQACGPACGQCASGSALASRLATGLQRKTAELAHRRRDASAEADPPPRSSEGADVMGDGGADFAQLFEQARDGLQDQSVFALVTWRPANGPEGSA